MQADTYNADIAKTIPEGFVPEIEDMLERTSQVLGMYEAYGALSQQDRGLEGLLDTDHLTVAVLEDLHTRTSSVTQNADEIADNGHVSGYVGILKLTNSEKMPDLADLREAASAVIAEGWNLEQDVPALAITTDLVVEDPFSDLAPDSDYGIDEIDF